MNRNVLKAIACLSMLIDHIGLLFFPSHEIFRMIGRLAFPIFAFFIGEGCRYTSSKLKYFLRVSILGILCQAVYIIEYIIRDGRFNAYCDCFYLNILITFSFSILLCCAYLYFEEQCAKGGRGPKMYLSIAVFVAALSLALASERIFGALSLKAGFNIQADYGLFGIILPLSVVICAEKPKKFAIFSLILALYCLDTYRQMGYVFHVLWVIPLLWIHNGKSGNKLLGKLCYIFYPAHLGILYLISMLI